MSDLIDRQAAIEAINTRRSVYSGMWGKGLSLAVDTLRDLPSAQPERPKGKWIRKKIKDEIGFNTSCYECSECNAIEAVYSAFCPNCGADMRGEQDE